jgi:hypothetical protein
VAAVVVEEEEEEEEDLSQLDRPGVGALVLGFLAFVGLTRLPSLSKGTI